MSAGTGTEFQTSDNVTFDDTAASTSVTINDNTVNPSGVIFNNSTKDYTVSGVNGINTGSIVKNGTGAVTISSSNSYTGSTTLNAGKLNINNASAIGAGALAIVGGTIDNTSGSAVVLSTNNTQSWNGDFAFGGSNDLNLGTGAVTLGASRTVTTNGTGVLTVGGVIGGSGFGLTNAGTGTLVLNGANTFNGGVAINGGTVQLGNNAALGDVAGGTTIFSGAQSASCTGSSAFTKSTEWRNTSRAAP